MKTLFRIVMSSLLLMVAAQTPALALTQVVLQCDLPTQEQNSWVQPSIVIAFEEGSDKALVADGIILALEGKPIWAEMRDNANRILLNWSVAGGRDTAGNQISTMHYVLELKKKNRSVSVRARPQGYANMFRGRGRCKPLENRAEMERLLKRL